MERDGNTICMEREGTAVNPEIRLQHPDAETVSRRLSEELPRIESAVKELELAKNVSRETLDRMISV